MLGVVIGLVSAVSLLVFLQKDPQAVKQSRQQKKKREEQHKEMVKKALQQQEKKMNDPTIIAKKLQKKNEMKEKMFKTLSQQERKLIDEYINEKKQAGKSQEQIMKDAGTKAMLFCLLMVIVTVFALMGIFIILNGDVDKVVSTFSEVIQLGKQFLEWNFPRMAANGAGASTGSGQL